MSDPATETGFELHRFNTLARQYNAGLTRRLTCPSANAEVDLFKKVLLVNPR